MNEPLNISYMSLRYIKTIEKNIKSKMIQIKKGQIKPVESGIGVQFKRLKELDEASYEKLLVEYVTISRNKSLIK